MKKTFYIIFILISATNLYSFEVEFFPKNRARSPTEIRLRFSKNIAPLGDPTYNYNPIKSIDCADMKNGTGIWEEPSLFIFRFDKPLPAGLKCNVELKGDIKSLDGERYLGRQSFQFDTDVVIVNNILPNVYQEIRNDEIFLFSFNGEVDIEKNIKKIYFLRKQVANSIGAILLSREDTENLIKEIYPHLKEVSPSYFAIKPKTTFADGEEIKVVFDNIESKSKLSSGFAQIFEYKVMDGFKIELSCERESAKKGCIPISPIRVDFSLPIEVKYARRFYLIDENGHRVSPVEPKEFNEIVHSISFEPPFKSEHKYKLYIPEDVVDIYGRKPVNADRFPLEFNTDRMPPLLKFASNFGIIEMIDGEAILPVTVRGLDKNLKIRATTFGDSIEHRVEQKRLSIFARIWEFIKSLFFWTKKEERVVSADKTFILPEIKFRSQNLSDIPEKRIFEIINHLDYNNYKESYFQKENIEYEEKDIPDLANFKESTVIGIPFKKYGLYLLEVESSAFSDYLVGENKNSEGEKAYLHSTVLVTNMAVTFKRGRDSSLVFVTGLSDGLPVEGASIKVFDCEGNEHYSGVTDKNGVLYIDKKLPPDDILPDCRHSSGEFGYRDSANFLESGLIVTARYQSDFSFVCSNWDKGLESYRFNIYKSWNMSKYAVHSVLSRNLLRAGETLHIVGYFRKKTPRDIIFPLREDLPGKIKIRHTGTDKVWEYSINWDDNYSTFLKWDVPKDASTGHYKITYSDCPYDSAINSKCEFDGGSFLVEEFKVPLIKGELIVKDSDEKRVNVEGIFNYLMGAPANDLQITLRYRFLDTFSFSDRRYNNYEFSRGKVKAGIQKPNLDYEEGFLEGVEYTDEEESIRRTPPNLPEQIQVKTDEFGRFKAEIPIRQAFERPFVLNIEAGYTDPNGYFNTITTSKTIYNSPFIIGITSKTDREKKEVNVKVVLLDREGKTVSGEEVIVNLYQKISYAHRKKVLGGYYSYEHLTEIKEPQEICRGKTDSNGILECKRRIEKGGDYILEALSGDNKRGISATKRSIYIFQYDENKWFDYASDSDRIDIFLDKDEYKAGEDIKIRVVSPFERCTALITVEQSGILNYFVQEFTSREPIITLKAEPDYAPNVVISVVLVRGRLSSPPPRFLIDLAKPSIKMGLSEVNIDKSKYRLDVNIKTDKKRYLVREDVNGNVEVRGANSDANLVLIVVDEGLLNLMENPTYDILNNIIKPVPYDVNTSSGLIQVVGRRHFGKKALPSGGGGGRLVTRELFDTLIYFNPSIKLKDGKAKFKFKLNDSITSFRIVAIVTSGSNKFGMAHKNIESERELFINSSIPYFAREGDKFDAEFVIKNIMDKEYNLDIRGNVTFYSNKNELGLEKLNIQGIKIEKGGNKKIAFPISIIENADEAKYHIEIIEGNRIIDSINVTQKIVESVPMRVVQSSFFRFKRSFKIDDKDTTKRDRKRRISLSFMNNLSGTGEVLKRYRGYSLSCLEQKISYAVVSNDLEFYNRLMNEINLYVDDNGLLKYYPSSKEGSPFLTAYILEITNLGGLELPYSIKIRTVDALKNFVMGKLSSRYFYSAGTKNIERIYALSAIRENIPDPVELMGALNPNISELPLSTLVDIGNVVPNRRDIFNAILSSFEEKGGAYFIRSDNKNNLWWLMRSEDEAFARSLIYFINNKGNDTMIGKMVKGLLNRFERGYLYNTTANAYAAVALRLFEKRYKNTIKESDLTVFYRCHQYKVGVKSDFVEQTFLFKINRDNSILGGEILPDCIERKNDELSFEDKNNDYWLRMLFEEESVPDNPVFKGFKITRELMDESGKKKVEFRQGELVKVRITVEADSYYNNVVIIDPLITGSQVIGRISKEAPEYVDYFWDYTYSDVRDGYLRTYYEYPYSKKIIYEYSVRLNTKGYFNIPPTRVELMYMPDIYGELPNSPIEVR
ncbi:MAG: alpha-2-macroglobulin family protein [Myxococcota bacterium]